MKINKCTKLVCNLYDKEYYGVHVRALKQALMQGLKLKKIHKVIQFYQEAWLKPYIDMNTELRKKAKNNFEKDFFKLMNNAVFRKTMENVKCFSENLGATQMKKTKVKINWYDYMKPKYGDNVKLCYTDTDSFIMNIKTEDFYKDIADDVECKFDTSNYEVDRPLPTGKSKKIIGLMKD